MPLDVEALARSLQRVLAGEVAAATAADAGAAWASAYDAFSRCGAANAIKPEIESTVTDAL